MNSLLAITQKSSYFFFFLKKWEPSISSDFETQGLNPLELIFIEWVGEWVVDRHMLGRFCASLKIIIQIIPKINQILTNFSIKMLFYWFWFEEF